MKIMSLEHRTIGFQFCSPMSPDIVWTFQRGGTEHGNNNMNVSKMPTSLSMTVKVVVPSWFGVESAVMEEQISMSRREEP
jgi:hypothetical protein